MKPPNLIRAISSRPSLWAPIALAAISLLTVAFAVVAQEGGCQHVQGRLVDGARFVGTIEGDYDVWGPGIVEPCPYPDVSCTIAYSTVTGNRSSVTFTEYGVLDFAEQVATNGAVLMMVQGGTGRWDGATGHVVLSGYFHTDTFESNWDYQGEVCTP
jgi:hypothetical protein